MKLLTKTTLYFLLAMIPLLAAGGYLLFSRFSQELNERVDQELVYNEIQWIQYLEAVTANGSRYLLRSPDILIGPVEAAPEQYPTIVNTWGAKARENVQIPFRQLTQVVSIHGVPYQIMLRQSQEQKAALVTNITWIMLMVFAGLFLASLLFNWLISSRLWQPFRLSLQTLRSLELQKMEAVQFGRTNIKEFNELNATLNSMTQKIHSDYTNMKEFTENAAHEMQTPLAVAQTKMELLLQDPSLSEPQMEAISQASLALSRLGKLNQSLLLLAKIENNQYSPAGEVDLVEHLEKYLRLFDEICKDKGLAVTTVFSEKFCARLHPFLADSLVSNLLGNAIKYNEKGGTLFLRCSEGELCISNSSSLPPIPPEQLFKRFSPTAKTPDASTGLGLAIAKKIADVHHLSLRYQFTEGMHQFCLRKTGR